MTTLLQIRDRCKQESDNVNSSFLTDAEWDNLINSSYRELYGLLVQAYGEDYFVQTPQTGYTFTTDGINQFFALPTDFFKLLGVDVMVTSPAQWASLKPFAFADRNRVTMFNTQIPMAGQTVRVFYVPRLTDLVLDPDVLVAGVTLNGWEEYIIADCAMKALAKEESDVTVVAARKRALVDRLEAEASNRDAGNPARIVDVMGRRVRSMQYRLNGSSIWLVGNAQPGYAYDGNWGGFEDPDMDFL